jgi:hypothetical protein
MQATRQLLPTIRQNDVATDRVGEELKPYDLEILKRCPVDFDRQLDPFAANLSIEDADTLWCLLVARPAFDYETRVRIDRVALDPVSRFFPVAGRHCGDVEMAGRKNQGAGDRTGGSQNFDLDMIGPADIRLAAAERDCEYSRRRERQQAARLDVPFLWASAT